MTKFKIKLYSVDYYEDEVEASSEEEAQDKLMDNIEEDKLEAKDGVLLFNGDEGFEVFEEMFSENCECGDDCDCK